MNAKSRRVFCCGLGALATGLIIPPGLKAQSEKVRPFCRFSLTEGWTDDGPAEYITHRAGANDKSGVPQVVARIRKVLAIQPTFDIYIAQNEDNAFATVANGRKILVVDVGFLEKLNRMASTQWSAIQVISHEVGHHIAGFTADRHRNELNADYWSGQALQRMGAAQEAATAAILAVGSEVDTPSHPNKRLRASTIIRGWTDASRSRIDYSFCNGCK